MSELVLLHHNEPMTTSEAIAEGTKMAHASVIKLVRNQVAQLQKFGEVAFQMRFTEEKEGTSGFQIQKSRHRPTEFAYLNEPQATLLITFMRNSEVVVGFKVALVKAFYEMRDRLRGDPQPQFLTSNLSHGADLAVAADRTFRSFLRAARSAGVALPKALRVANDQTRTRTGMDMLAELGVEVADLPAVGSNAEVVRFLNDWLAGQLPVPVCICRNADLYAAYRQWCRVGGLGALRDTAFHPAVRRAGLGVRQSHVALNATYRVRATVPPGAEAAAVNGEKGPFYAASIARFADAVKDWS